MIQSPTVSMPEWLNQVDPLHRDSLWHSIQEADKGELIDESDSIEVRYIQACKTLNLPRKSWSEIRSKHI